MNIRKDKIVNLPPEEVALAEALALDERTVRVLVDIIFSQIGGDVIPS